MRPLMVSTHRCWQGVSPWINSSIGSRSCLCIMSWNICRKGKITPFLSRLINADKRLDGKPFRRSKAICSRRRRFWRRHSARNGYFLTCVMTTDHQWIYLTPFAVSLQTLMDRGMRQSAQTSPRSTTGPSVISDHFPNEKKKNTEKWLRWHLK